MNPGTFDQLTRRLVARVSRRTLLGGAMATLAFGSVISREAVRADTSCKQVSRFTSWDQLALCDDLVQIKEPTANICSVPPVEHVSVPKQREWTGNIFHDIGETVATHTKEAVVTFRDSTGTANWLPACQNHDRCYTTCGTLKDECDQAFRNDLSAACLGAYGSWWQASLLAGCEIKAELYYQAVSKTPQGRNGFQDSQLEYCGCCHDSASEHEANNEVETVCGPVSSPLETFTGSLMYGGDAARTGQQPGPGPDANAAVDQRFLDSSRAGVNREELCGIGVWDGTPVLFTGDRIYVGGTDGSEANGIGTIWHGLASLDPVTGSTVWFAHVFSGSQSSVFALGAPAFADGALYVSSWRNLVRLDAETGAEVWRIDVEGGTTVPIVVDGVVYVIEGGKLLALDAATGATHWSVQSGGWSVAIRDEKLLVPSPAGLDAYDVTTGDHLWTFPGQDLGSGLSLGAGAAYLATDMGDVIAVSLVDGHELWRATVFAGSRIPTVSIDGDHLVVGTSRGLIGLNAQSGGTRWEVPGDGTAFSSAAIADGIAYAVTLDGLVVAVDIETGSTVWTISTPVTGSYGHNGRPTFLPQPGVANGRVAFTNSHGWVYVIA